MLQLIEPADTNDLPVDLDVIKADLGITGTPNNARLTELIWRATDICEQYTGRTYCVQTYQLTLPHFSRVIDIPRPPLDTIDFVKYYNSENVLTTMDSSNYYILKSDFNNQIQFIQIY